jgi:hypothetical protein
VYEPEFNIRWDPTLTAEKRYAVLRRYGERYGCREFVETGTSIGDTCLALADAFEHIYTIEVGNVAYNKARARLRAHRHVELFLGDSAEVLPQILEKLSGPALFWLDGHLDSGGTQGKYVTPICWELEAIFATGVPHVILIDDARMFGGGLGAKHGRREASGDKAYPSIEWVRNIATHQDIEYRFAYVDDIMRLTPPRP